MLDEKLHLNFGGLYLMDNYLPRQDIHEVKDQISPLINSNYLAINHKLNNNKSGLCVNMEGTGDK